MGKEGEKNRLVVGDLGWAETLPSWLLEAIRIERLALGLAGLTREDTPKVGDAEVCAYLYTASLHGPMSAEYCQIYFYLGAKVMRKTQPDTKLPDMMIEALEQGLTAYEERELEDLKAMIYQKRGGEISHPILDALKTLRKSVEKAENERQLSFL